ncbi:MAG: hypothetical protein A2W36_03025, partial [Chloroflexi bacterium RBG_16_58_14]
MNQNQSKNLKIAFVAILVFAVFFLLTQSTSAQGIFYGDTVPAGTVVDNDVILFGDDVVVAGDVSGDLFVLGRTVTISGTVEGSVFTIGEIVNTKGTLQGSQYVAAIRYELEQNASIARNLYFLGVSLSAQSGSTIGRDLYAFTVGATMGGEIGRDVNAIIGPVEIFLYFSDQFGQGKFSPWSGTTPSLGSGLAGMAASRVAGLLLPLHWLAAPAGVGQAQAAGFDWSRLGEWAVDRLRDFAVLLIIGLFFAWLYPNYLPRVAKRTTVRPWLALGYGMVALITGFAATLLAAFLVILIAVGLAYLGLGNLAFLLGAMGLFALGLTFFVFYLFVFYVSRLVVAYLGGTYLFRWLSPKAAEHRFWPLLAGLVLYVLLVSIPYLGWAIAFIAV